MVKTALLQAIRLYQRTISPDTGWFSYRHPYGFCRFAPTCSEYAYQAIHRHGSRKGCYVALLRLLRCHPWHAGGYDPVTR